MNEHDNFNQMLAPIVDSARKLMDMSNLEPERYISGYKGIAAYTCLWVPVEILRTGGYQPLLLRGRALPPSEGSFECGRCSGLEKLLESNSIPKLAFLAIADVCNQIMKTALRVSQSAGISLFYLQSPKGQSEEDLRQYVHQLGWLREVVCSEMSEHDFAVRFEEVYKNYGELRSLLAQIRDRAKIPCEVFYLLQAASTVVPYEQTIPLLKETAEICNELPELEGVRLMMIGGNLGYDEWDVVSAICEAGGVIAADLMCNSGRATAAKGAKKTIDDLAIEYFNRLPCMPVEPNRRFYDTVEHLLSEKDIQGVIYYKPENCDSYEHEHERVMWRSQKPIMSLDGAFLSLSRKQQVEHLRDFIRHL